MIQEQQAGPPRASDPAPGTLRPGALSLFESIVMGLAGSAPGFSVATTAAVLLSTAGRFSINALLVFAVPMLGIAVAYKALNQRAPRAGAAYDWTTDIFGRLPGFLSGWALLVSTLVFMVSGGLTLGANLLNVVDASASANLPLTTGIGAVCFTAIGAVLIAGIGLTSKLQVLMTSVELVILAVVGIAAAVHAATHGAVQAPSWSWLAFGYTRASFAATALVVVFFYWGWDVACNLGEETAEVPPNAAGTGGFVSVFLAIGIFVAFTMAALVLFPMRDAQGFTVNIVYRIALASGLGVPGARAASFAVVLSSIATMETSMLQFSRTLYSMSRDRAMPTALGLIDPRTRTPVRTMLLLIGLGLVLMAASSALPTVATIMTDSVNAIAIQVCTYYALSGLAAAWVWRSPTAASPVRFVLYCLFPLLSAVALIVLGIYALTSFDVLTRIVGVGGLAVGLLFYRPSGWAPMPATAIAG